MKAGEKITASILALPSLYSKPPSEVKPLLVNHFNKEDYSESEILSLFLIFVNRVKEIAELKQRKLAKPAEIQLESLPIISKWCYQEYQKVSHAFFLNAFIWSFSSRQWEVQAAVYQKKFISRAIKNISEALESTEKTEGQSYFLKILTVYTIELLFTDASNEEIQTIINDHIELAELLDNTSESKIIEIHGALQKSGLDIKYEDFISQLDFIKTYFGSPEIVQILKTITLDEILTHLKNTIYTAEGDSLLEDDLRLVEIERYIIDGMYSMLNESDAFSVALIYALNDYQQYLQGIQTKPSTSLSGVLKFAHIDIAAFIQHMVDCECFYQRDTESLIKLFSGSKIGQKITFCKKTNVLGTILFELYEAKKIEGSKESLSNWMAESFVSRNGKAIGHAYIVKLLTKEFGESNRLSKYAVHHVDVDKFI